jgi:hypothetical protein
MMMVLRRNTTPGHTDAEQQEAQHHVVLQRDHADGGDDALFHGHAVRPGSRSASVRGSTGRPSLGAFLLGQHHHADHGAQEEHAAHLEGQQELIEEHMPTLRTRPTPGSNSFAACT